MARADWQRGRTGIASLELLESRSLLSNLDLSVSIPRFVAPPSVDSAHVGTSNGSLSPEVGSPDAQAPSKAVTISSDSHGVIVRVGEPHAVISGLLTSDKTSELIIEIKPLGPAAVGSEYNAYLEGGWIVIELPVASPEMEPVVDVFVSSGGSPNPLDSVFVLPQQATPLTLGRVPEHQIDLRGVNSIELIEGLGAIHSQGVAEDLLSRKVFETHINGRGEGTEEDLQNSSAVAPMFPTALPFYHRSSPPGVLQLDLMGESPDVAVPHQLLTGPDQHESIDSSSWITQPPADTCSQPDPEGVVAEMVKGIKIRGAYVDPTNAGEGRRVVDLAVIRFETPTAVRVQLPFVLGVQDEISESVSDAGGSGEIAPIVEAVDAVLMAETDGTGTEMANWHVSGLLAICAAAVGYIVGSRRSPLQETQADVASTEPFIPVFSEAQLRRLSGRLSPISRRPLSYSRQSFRLASTTSDGFLS